ncbi:MAG TPA: transaldolase [Puia sp.]|nr:transaldolase [Puia sp.]
MKKGNNIFETYSHGQSIWLDYIDRGLIRSGELEHMIRDEGLTGMTSNPTIFEKSISGSDQYNDQIKDLIARGKGNEEVFYSLALDDIEAAADLFKRVYDNPDRPGGDGFVSIEVSPRLARDTVGSIQQGTLLWQKAARRNVMIKIPATTEGLAAIRRLTGDGVNVNITLLFGLRRYKQVIDAYLGGLEDRLAAGQPISGISSVASFFLSRVDVLLDPQLEKKGLGDLKGKVAIALAKKAYAIYKNAFIHGQRFLKLAEKGAARQRLLWASTSTKDPSFPDTKYVDALIGRDTIDTVPPETFRAFIDHGKVTDSLETGLQEAEKILSRVEAAGFSMDQVGQQLEDEGVEKFMKPYDKLMDSIEAKRRSN